MKLLLKRVALQATYSQGYLFIDNQYFCDTLEHREYKPGKDRKNVKEVALPSGCYQLDLNYSGRHKRVLPFIHPVRGKDYMIHHGSRPKDAKGIIVGKNASIGWIEDSERMLKILISLIRLAINKGEKVTLLIK